MAGSVRGLFELKHLIDGFFKDVGDLESQLQTGKVFGVFDGHDRLPCNPHRRCQILLRHLGRVKAQAADLICYSAPGQGQKPRRYRTSLVTSLAKLLSAQAARIMFSTVRMAAPMASATKAATMPVVITISVA
jgi:hypothetical protein